MMTSFRWLAAVMLAAATITPAMADADFTWSFDEEVITGPTTGSQVIFATFTNTGTTDLTLKTGLPFGVNIAGTDFSPYITDATMGPSENPADFYIPFYNYSPFSYKVFSPGDSLTFAGFNFDYANAPAGTYDLTRGGYLSLSGITRAPTNNIVITISDAAVPESSTWAMMLVGFGTIGAAMRRRPMQRMPQCGKLRGGSIKRALATIAFLFVTATVTAPASAETFVFSGTMSGLNEAPPNASTATGSFNAVLDDMANSFFVDLSFAGLSSNASSGNLHCCAPAGANAGSILDFTGFPSATSGTYSRTLYGLTDANVTEIKSGLSYINIRTFALPAGEIRGQLMLSATASVPEPATWAMMLVGFGAIGATMRLRRNTCRTFDPRLRAAAISTDPRFATLTNGWDLCATGGELDAD